MTAIDALYAAGKGLLDDHRTAGALHIFRAMLVSAPEDERGWLGLGATHEALGQPLVALDLYGYGAVVCGGVRLHVARARLLRAAGHDDEADLALEAAEAALDARCEDDEHALVRFERRAA